MDQVLPPTNRMFFFFFPIKVEIGAKAKDGRYRSVEQVRMLDGEKSGEYFGASLLSMDINGDGLDELIVGSPLYTYGERQESAKSFTGFDEGKISIYRSQIIYYLDDRSPSNHTHLSGALMEHFLKKLLH